MNNQLKRKTHTAPLTSFSSIQARAELFFENSQFEAAESYFRRTLEKFSQLKTHQLDWLRERLFTAVRMQGRTSDALKLIDRIDVESSAGALSKSILIGLCDAGFWEDAESVFDELQLDLPTDLATGVASQRALDRAYDCKVQLMKLTAQAGDWDDVRSLAGECLQIQPSDDEVFELFLTASQILGSPNESLLAEAANFLDRFPTSRRTLFKAMELASIPPFQNHKPSFLVKLADLEKTDLTPEEQAIAAVWLSK